MEKHEMQLLHLLVHVIVHKRRTSGIEAIIEVKSSTNNLEQSDQPLVSVFHNSCACVHRFSHHNIS